MIMGLELSMVQELMIRRLMVIYTSTFCEPSDNQTVTFDFTSLPGGGITVGSSLRMYLNSSGTTANWSLYCQWN